LIRPMYVSNWSRRSARMISSATRAGDILVRPNLPASSVSTHVGRMMKPLISWPRRSAAARHSPAARRRRAPPPARGDAEMAHLAGRGPAGVADRSAV
jgi:hypothetical protein